MLPIVALVGRPNVGKSTLFNRMVGKQLAIVHDQPGVTRDRHYADAFLQGHELTLIDTGGFDPDDQDPMRQGIRKHVEAAIEQADVIVCVLDALSPATEADRQAVRLLRAADKPVVYLANRADNERAELEASELYRLGVDPLICGSALHGRRMAQLEAAIVARLPEAGPPESPLPEGTARVALLGRPNAGKSSLLNRLSGEERSLVDDRPGTTRDPIDALIEFEGKPYMVVDTAGMRRRSKVIEDIEAASVMRSVRCIWRSDVVVLMCDADLGVAEQDAKLLSLAASRGRAIILGLNKADLLSKQRLQEVEREARVKLHFAPWVPIVSLSAKSGRGVRSLMRRVDRSFEEFRRRISTAQLNRFFEEVMERKPPPTKGSRAPRVYYVTQAQSAPPMFIVICSFPEAISDAYQRFIANEIRAAFGFQSVPIKVRFRGRKQRAAEAD